MPGLQHRGLMSTSKDDIQKQADEAMDRIRDIVQIEKEYMHEFYREGDLDPESDPGTHELDYLKD
jgi:hypothetical protein